MRRHVRNQQQAPSQSAFSIFLRSVGLDTLNAFKSRILGNNTELEPKKLFETTSLRIAFQRCAVHLLPCTFSIFLVTINLQGYFIGFELEGKSGQTSQYLALLQIAAKAQELLMVASLTTIVVYKLRHDLIEGEGVPFGLVGAGSLFSQFSYFWSTAFIGSVSTGIRLNVTLVGLVLLAGLIAITAGPAVAVLLIPREQAWLAGGTTYWINGTTDDLWPSRVGLEHYMPEIGTDRFGVSCSSPRAYTNALCPAGGFGSLMSRFSSSDSDRPWSGSKDSRYRPASLLIWSPLGQVPPYNMVSSQRARTALQSSAVGIHGPASWVAATLNNDWQRSVDMLPIKATSRLSRYRYYSTMRSVINTWVPAVRVVCSDSQFFQSGQRSLQFPVVGEFERAIINTNSDQIFDDKHPGEPRELLNVQLPNGTLENLQYTQYPRVSTIDLSNLSWTTATTGIIIESAWADKRETFHKVSSCVVDARWAKGAVSVGLAQAVEPEIFSITNSPKSFWVSSESYRAFDMFKSDEGPRDSWRRINITDEWLNSLNLPLSKDSNLLYSSIKVPVNLNTTTDTSSDATTISWLITAATSDTFFIPTIEHTLAVVFADALARAGSWRVLDVTQPAIDRKYHPIKYHKPKPDPNYQLLWDGEGYENPSFSSSETFTKVHMRQEITGYALKASSSTDILALTVMFIYLLITLLHIMLSLLRRNSSSCWDSVAELLALTQQSSPSTTALRNTATGIERLSTFRQRARIRVSRYDSEHLELTFDTDCDGNVIREKPHNSRKYG